MSASPRSISSTRRLACASSCVVPLTAIPDEYKGAIITSPVHVRKALADLLTSLTFVFKDTLVMPS